MGGCHALSVLRQKLGAVHVVLIIPLGHGPEALAVIDDGKASYGIRSAKHT